MSAGPPPPVYLDDSVLAVESAAGPDGPAACAVEVEATRMPPPPLPLPTPTTLPTTTTTAATDTAPPLLLLSPTLPTAAAAAAAASSATATAAAATTTTSTTAAAEAEVAEVAVAAAAAAAASRDANTTTTSGDDAQHEGSGVCGGEEDELHYGGGEQEQLLHRPDEPGLGLESERRASVFIFPSPSSHAAQRQTSSAATAVYAFAVATPLPPPSEYSALDDSTEPQLTSARPVAHELSGLHVGQVGSAAAVSVAGVVELVLPTAPRTEEEEMKYLREEMMYTGLLRPLSGPQWKNIAKSHDSEAGDVSSKLALLVRSACAWLDEHLPLFHDCQAMDSHYGNGIGMLFHKLRFMFLTCLAVLFVWLVFEIAHIAREPNGSFLLGIFPVVFFQSSLPGDMATSYSFVMLIVVLLFIAVSMWKLLTEGKKAEMQKRSKHDVKSVRFSNVVLSSWQISFPGCEKYGRADYCQGQVDVLTVELSGYEHKAFERDHREMLFKRRLLGFLLTGLLCVCNWVVLLCCTYFNSQINSTLQSDGYYSMLPMPILLSIVNNAVVPSVVERITEREKWKPKVEVVMVGVRVFVCQILNIVITLFSLYQLLVNTEFIAGTAADSDPNFGGCVVQQVGAQIFLFACFDFLLGMACDATAAVRPHAWRWLRMKWRKPWDPLPERVQREPVSIAPILVSNSFFMVWVWVGTPYYPPGMAALGAACLFCLFKFHKTLLDRFLAKPVQPWSGSQVGVFFVRLYVIGFVLALSSFYFFFQASANSMMSAPCGPFPPDESMAGHLFSVLAPIPVLSLFQTSWLVWCGALACLVVLLLSVNSVQVLTEFSLEQHVQFSQYTALLETAAIKLHIQQQQQQQPNTLDSNDRSHDSNDRAHSVPQGGAPLISRIDSGVDVSEVVVESRMLDAAARRRLAASILRSDATSRMLKYDWADLISSGQINSLPCSDLQEFLAYNKKPIYGSKLVLVRRVAALLDLPFPPDHTHTRLFLLLCWCCCCCCCLLARLLCHRCSHCCGGCGWRRHAGGPRGDHIKCTLATLGYRRRKLVDLAWQLLPGCC